MSRMGEYQREITIYDPGTRTVNGPEITVSGTSPALVPPSWWPWIIGAAVLGGLWYITREERSGPLAGGAG
jgi:hypothetical protein